MGVPERGKLFPQPFGTKVFIPPIAFAILVHRPVVAELAEVVWLGEWCDGQALALGFAEGAVPGLLVEALTGCGGNPTHGCLSTASAHGALPADGARQEAARHAMHSGSGYCSVPETKSPAGAGLSAQASTLGAGS